MQVYTRTQFSYLILVLLVVFTGAVGYSFFYINHGNLQFSGAKISLGIWLAAMLLLGNFLTMTVTVTENQILAKFGPGLIRFRYNVSSVVSALAVRNPWLAGWGIRFLPGLLLLNVSGFDAVEIQFNDTGRRVRLGTPDPQGLEAAIRQVVRKAATPR